ncbi:MAG: outer membrane protein assembly factor BamD [Deltaproteobacteria bacterium]|nr:outer membrane protein assembly factor BamD [Deltaproteobacteria bacterium]
MRFKYHGMGKWGKWFLCFLSIAIISGCAGTKGAERKEAHTLYAEGVELYQKGKYTDAIERLKLVMEDHPLSAEAQSAELLLADSYFGNEEYDDAAAYYANFVSLHPRHPRAAYAQFQKGMSYFRQISTLDRDQTPVKKALIAFQDLTSSYPSGSYAEKSKDMILFLRKRLAERELYIANFYFKNKNYKGALARYSEILKEYPDVGLTDKTLYSIGESYMKLGEKDLAKDAFSNLISTYPDSPFAKDAKGWLKSI